MTDEEIRLDEERSAKEAAKAAGLDWERVGEFRVSIFMPKEHLPRLLVELVKLTTEIKMGLERPHYINSLGIQAARQITARLQGENGVYIVDEKADGEVLTEELVDFVGQLKEVWEDEGTKGKVLGTEKIQPPSEGIEWIDLN